MSGADPPFDDRRHAGRLLADQLGRYLGSAGLLVLALPRGGVPVGFEVARALRATLDICMVRKLGFPGQEEFAMGAIASGGMQVMAPMAGFAVSAEAAAEVVAREQAELQRRELLYRGQQPGVSACGRAVIVVDDGLATGASLCAAVMAIRQQHPAVLVAAVPVGSKEGCAAVRKEVDELVCSVVPHRFHAVSQWYQSFPQTSDGEVCALLEQARHAQQRLAGLNALKTI